MFLNTERINFIDDLLYAFTLFISVYRFYYCAQKNTGS